MGYTPQQLKARAYLKKMAELLGTKTDQELADKLGCSRTSVATYRSRGILPQAKVALAAKLAGVNVSVIEGAFAEAGPGENSLEGLSADILLASPIYDQFRAWLMQEIKAGNDPRLHVFWEVTLERTFPEFKAWRQRFIHEVKTQLKRGPKPASPDND